MVVDKQMKSIALNQVQFNTVFKQAEETISKSFSQARSAAASSAVFSVGFHANKNRLNQKKIRKHAPCG